MYFGLKMELEIDSTFKLVLKINIQLLNIKLERWVQLMTSKVYLSRIKHYLSKDEMH
jgi:hypothetical protein